MMAKDAKANRLGELKASLQEAAKAPAPRPPSVFETVKALLPEIDALKAKRWTDAQIRDRLSANGCEMALGTFRQYYQRASREVGGTSKRAKNNISGERKAKENANATPKPSELATAPRATTGEGKKNLGHKLGDDDV